ncbi:MAG: hypothetical protein FWB76_04030 [Oscillospiraceae bacterium]|nr:hypothetical protein [Oscillospiraceae bacterium]
MEMIGLFSTLPIGLGLMGFGHFSVGNSIAAIGAFFVSLLGVIVGFYSNFFTGWLSSEIVVILLMAAAPLAFIVYGVVAFGQWLNR